MLSAEQLNASVPTCTDAPSILAAASFGENVDAIWVIAHVLREAASCCDEVMVMSQVCRSWKKYVCEVKDELYGAILPRRFPRLRYLGLVLETSKQVMRLHKEEQYRRNLQAQTFLLPLQEEVWENLRDRNLMDPDMACILEVWQGCTPIIFAALAAMANKKQELDSCPLTELLKDLHAKEEQFLKSVLDDGIHSDMRAEQFAALYDTMNKACGWDKLCVMVYVSNGDEVVRVCRAAFLSAMHDGYVFGNSLQNPKLVIRKDGLIGLPMQDESQVEVGTMVKNSMVGERVRVQGLISAHQHNGKEGSVSSHIADTGRFGVDLNTGESIAVKPSNLRLAAEACPMLTAEDKQEIMSLKLLHVAHPLLMSQMIAMAPDPSWPPL